MNRSEFQAEREEILKHKWIESEKAGHGAPVSWNDFTRSNAVALAAIQQTDAADQEKKEKQSADEPYARVLEDFLDYLARDVGFVPDRPLSKDIQSLRAAIVSIIEAKNEDVLTEEECIAVLNFIVSSFVARRFDRVFKHMLPSRESKHWFYTSRKVLQ